MRSGTGVRDSYEGDYLDVDELGLSQELRNWLADWLERYRLASDENFVQLDRDGLQLARRIQDSLEAAKVVYYSDATGHQTLSFDQVDRT